MSQQRAVLGILLIVALLAPSMILAQPVAPQAAVAPVAAADPFLFVENAGQWPADGRFQALGLTAGCRHDLVGGGCDLDPRGCK